MVPKECSYTQVSPNLQSTVYLVVRDIVIKRLCIILDVIPVLEQAVPPFSSHEATYLLFPYNTLYIYILRVHDYSSSRIDVTVIGENRN